MGVHTDIHKKHGGKGIHCVGQYTQAHHNILDKTDGGNVTTQEVQGGAHPMMFVGLQTQLTIDIHICIYDYMYVTYKP